MKLHGHRIELGEIEYHLQQHPDIHQAIVVVDNKHQRLIGYIMPEKHTINKYDYNESEMTITDHSERTNFKLARHGILRTYEIKMNIPLKRPKQTQALIDMYYTRKSYRQFTNEIIEKVHMEYLLTKCHSRSHVNKISTSCMNVDNLSQLLSVLTPIIAPNQPLPKYRYASAGSLYPVQVYVEVFSNIDNIPPGVYYHNPDKHTLEYIVNCSNYDHDEIRFHFIGRSSAIAPLYGKTLSSHLSTLETGYMIGLLQKEAAQMG